MPADLPLRLTSTIIRGFGRGSRDLGIPTANLDKSLLEGCVFEALSTGIYYGFAGLVGVDGKADAEVYPAAISVGFNPTYNNTEKTIEPHFICPPSSPYRKASICSETQMPDFYGRKCRLAIVGYIRPEMPYAGVEPLIAAIKEDIKVTEGKCGEGGEVAVEEREWCRSGK